MKLKMPCDIKTQKDYDNLAHYIRYVTRSYRYIRDYDNLVSDLMVVFLECCKDFDAKKAQLHTYAHNRFVQRAYRAIKKHELECKLFTASCEELFDTYPSHITVNYHKVAYEILKYHVPKWLVDMIEQGKTDVQIAREQNTSKEQVRLAIRYCASSLKKRGYSL